VFAEVCDLGPSEGFPEEGFGLGEGMDDASE